MTQEDKQLLLQDICARLPYQLKMDCGTIRSYHILQTIYVDAEDGHVDLLDDVGFTYELEDVKPLLRSPSNMTEEERVEFREIGGVMSYNSRTDTWAITSFTPEAYDWLNAKNFDYRGLIERDLAIEVTEENNPYKENDTRR